MFPIWRCPQCGGGHRYRTKSSRGREHYRCSGPCRPVLDPKMDLVRTPERVVFYDELADHTGADTQQILVSP